MNSSFTFQVNDQSWLSGSVKVPFLLVPKTTKGKFHMAPPASVDLIGSYPLGTCSKPRVMVDLAVTIPAVSPHLHILFNSATINELWPVISSYGCRSPSTDKCRGFVREGIDIEKLRQAGCAIQFAVTTPERNNWKDFSFL